MTIVSVSAEALVGSTGITSAAKDFTGMNLIVVAVTNYNGRGSPPDESSPALTDSVSNTYTKLETATGVGSSNDASGFYYVVSPTVSTAQTFTYHVANSSDFPSIAVIGWDSAAASPLDIGDNAHMNSSNTSAATATTPNAVTNQAQELLVAMFGGGASTSVSAGWTLQENQPNTSGQEIALAYQIVASTGTYSAQFNLNPNGSGEAGICTWKQAVAVTATIRRMGLMGVGR